jgi:Concanavalin A-like lectin/glucanases superfamily
MAEFKFFCPQCGRNIQCGTSYSGTQINCPACQQPIAVPQAPREASPAVPPPVAVKSRALQNVLLLLAAVAVLAGLVIGGWYGYLKFKLHKMPPGLVASWPDNDSPNEGVGVGVLMNGAGFAPGKTGRAFDLNANASDAGHRQGFYPGGGYVQIPASPALDAGKNGGFTFTAWINPAKLLYQMPILEYEKAFGTYNGSNIGVEFYVMGEGGGGAGPGCLFTDIIDAVGTEKIRHHELTSAPGLVTVNAWQHVALSYDKDSGMAAIYLNGSSVLKTNIGSFTPNTKGGILIGGRTVYGTVASPSGIFSGKLENVGIYDHALLASEVQSIYEAQK